MALTERERADFVARTGVSSRLRPAPGRKRPWPISDDVMFALPIIVDYVIVDDTSGDVQFVAEGTVDLIGGQPALVEMRLRAPEGLDVQNLQREFRWASLLTIVREGVPALLARGEDPFTVELPVTGFPEAATLDAPSNAPLTDEFLLQIAEQYLAIGRGYPAVIAAERGVTERTVISWIVKARDRGLLSRVPKGSIGGVINRP